MTRSRNTRSNSPSKSQKVQNPRNIAPIPKDIRATWSIINGKNPNKISNKGKEYPVESSIFNEEIKVYMSIMVPIEQNVICLYHLI